MVPQVYDVSHSKAKTSFDCLTFFKPKKSEITWIHFFRCAETVKKDLDYIQWLS